MSSDGSPIPDQMYWITKALGIIDDKLTTKARDYGGFEWFEKQCILGEITPRQMFRTDIGRKLNRESESWRLGVPSEAAQFEAIFDLAGYSILWLAYTLMTAETE